MKPTNHTWHKIAETIEELNFSPSGLAYLEVNGKKICLGRHKDQLYACTAACPHASGNLAEGYIDAIGNIVCPIHRYKFSLQTGRNTSGEGYFLKRFTIETREDGIYIGIDSDNLFK